MDVPLRREALAWLTSPHHSERLPNRLQLVLAVAVCMTLAVTLAGTSTQSALGGAVNTLLAISLSGALLTLIGVRVTSLTWPGLALRLERRITKDNAPLRMLADTLPDLPFTKDRERTEAALRHLSTQLMKSQDDERRRIAREIHDTTVQNLAAAKMQIDQVRNGAISAGALAATALDEARDLLDQSLSELRTLSYLLHPPLLEELGLAPAVRWYAQGFEQRSGIAISVDTAETMPRLSADTETALFRVIQEGLTNIYRHSGSREARVAIAWHRDRLELEIIDKGRGMPNPTCRSGTRNATSLGVGIPGMRIRIQQIGGRLELRSSANGTALRAVVPRTVPCVVALNTLAPAAAILDRGA